MAVNQWERNRFNNLTNEKAAAAAMTFPRNLEKAAPSLPVGPPGGWLSERMSLAQQIAFNVLVAFLQIIPQSTLTTVFPTREILARSFRISDSSILTWLVAAYALSFGTFILVSGRFGDIFGHKSLVVLGFSSMSLWSVVAGLSHYATCEVFFVARGLQGISAAMMVPNGLALLGRTYAPRSRQKVISFTLFGLCAPLGAYLGTLFGSVFAQLLSWWWSYYTLALVSAVLAIFAQLVLISPPKTPSQMESTIRRLGQMDWYGTVFGVSGLVLVQFSLVSAPTKGWNRPYIYFCLIVGLLLISFFIISELKIAKQPLVPFKLLKAEVVFVLIAVSCGWATFGVWAWYLWRWLLDFKDYVPLDAALHAAPIVPIAVVSSALVSILARRTPPAFVLFFALAALTIGCVLLAIANVGSPYWTYTFLSLIITPFGMNMSFSSATMILSNAFPPHQQGVAGSLITTCVNYSIGLGLGLATTVEVHVNNHGVDELSGVRGGFYFGVGIGGLGLVICMVFLLRSLIHGSPLKQRISEPILTERIHPRQRRRQSDRKFSHASTLVSPKASPVKELPLLGVEASRPTTARTTRSEIPDIPLHAELQRGARSFRSSIENLALQSGHYFEYSDMTALPTWIGNISPRTSVTASDEEYVIGRAC